MKELRYDALAGGNIGSTCEGRSDICKFSWCKETAEHGKSLKAGE